jgi:hypothetical protein
MLNDARLLITSSFRMHSVRTTLLASAFMLVALISNMGSASAANAGFGFNGDINTSPPAAVSLSGGGSFNLDGSFVHAGGGFRCTGTIAQGLLAGCAVGEGVRWDAEELLGSAGFKCVGSESLKTATTGDGVVVMKADFYRAGDGNTESFTANMFVSNHDLDLDVAGIQNVWIQGVGCGPAIVHFSS